MFKIMSGGMILSNHETLEEAKKELTQRRDDKDKDVDRLLGEIDVVEDFFNSFRIVHEEDK